MTKKDYVIIAEAIAEAHNNCREFIDGEDVATAQEGVSKVRIALERRLYADNRRFDVNRFRDYIEQQVQD